MIEDIDAVLGRLAESVHGGWVLNPDTTFPLTIQGVSRDQAARFRAMLNKAFEDVAPDAPPTDPYAIVRFMASTKMVCKEVTDYVEENRSAFTAGRDPDSIPYFDPDALFLNAEVSDTDRDLVCDRHGWNTIKFYLRNKKMIDEPRLIWPEHRDRERFKNLASLGLASFGGTIERKGKRGDAVSLAAAPFRSTLETVGDWMRRCEAIADNLSHTYSCAAGTTNSIRFNRLPEIVEITKGYECCPVGDDFTCKLCRRMSKLKYHAMAPPRTPFHLGCRCSSLSIHK